MKKKLFIVFGIIFLLNVLELRAKSNETMIYIFTSFRGNGDGLHLALSEDGLT